MATDVLALAQALIRCPSVTPVEAGALDVVESMLKPLGFVCTRQTFEGDGGERTENLYARFGTSAPNLCFAGHVDVVTVGDPNKWSHPPFNATVHDGKLIGRGACDMKAAIAAMLTATENFVKAGSFSGSISFLITCDEEGRAINGTRKMLEYITQLGEKIDGCVVGEPTSEHVQGDIIKIGRRGSINTHVVSHGKQGHVAYPHLAENPVPALLDFLHAVQHHVFDAGSEFFPASHLEITTIDVGNATTNVIPATAEARFNIRFNPAHNSAELKSWLQEIATNISPKLSLDFHVSGEAFLSPPARLSEVASAAVQAVTGLVPKLTTTGGTSDARFIQAYSPVVEFGARNATAHMVDECVTVDEVYQLEKIYSEMLKRFFS